MAKTGQRRFLSYLSLIFCAVFGVTLFGGQNPRAAQDDWRAQQMLQPQAQAMPLLPFLDYYIDETLSLDIEEAAALANSYQPLVLDKLPRTEGILWLRFTIAPLAPNSRPQTFLLDMGQSVPGEPVLYTRERNELSGALEWRENLPAERNILLLPEAENEAIVCFIRMGGLPGPWFAPMIRTPRNAASNWGSLMRTGAILALGTVMLLCLLRGLSESGQWRIWTALYVGVALAQAVFGMPVISENFNLGSFVAVLAPGVALMLLPHVGRHLIRTRQRSRSLDRQLALLSLPGAALALWPLFPGWSWLDRWLDIWPLGTLLFVPTALGAWIMGLGGARRFLSGCIIPPVFVGVALAGLDFGLPANLLASAPLWGVALSALLIAATRSPLDMVTQDSGDSKPRPEKKEKRKKWFQKADTPKLNLEHTPDNPLDDPNLRIMEPEEEVVNLETPIEEAVTTGPEILSPAVHGHETSFDPWTNALTSPLEDIIREGEALAKTPLSPAAQNSVEIILEAGRDLAALMLKPQLAVSAKAKPEKPVPPTIEPSNEVFNLQQLMRDARDSVAARAQSSSTALSWYIPPHLCQVYEGDAARLGHILHLLLGSAVAASQHGAVRLSARRMPESADNGNILFTVADNCGVYPPNGRDGATLQKVWEVVGDNNGYLGIESGQDGTSISFSMRFKALENMGDITPGQPIGHVIIACQDGARRRELLKMLEDIPCRASEAANAREALDIQRRDPAVLLIAVGELASPEARDLATGFTEIGQRAGLDLCNVLALTPDNSQWAMLKPSGFTHAMIEPVDPASFRETVSELAQSSAPPADIIPTSNPVESNVGEMTVETSETDRSGMADSVQPLPPVEPENGEEASGYNLEGNETPGGDELQQPAGAPVTEESMGNEKTSPETPDSAMPAIHQGFEGPDWLEDQPTPKGNADSPLPAEAKNGQPKHEAITERTGTIAYEPAPAQKREADSASPISGAPGEWVGEPVPITPGKEVTPPRTMPEAASHPMDTADEWVGEPAPIVKEKAEAPDGSTGEKEPTSTPLTDFIVGVERKGETGAEDRPNPMPGEGMANKTVRDFVDSSVSLVSNTLSTVLANADALKKSVASRQPADAVANPQENERQPAGDPIIINLLQKLDKAMNDANEAFEKKQCALVAEATARLGQHSGSFGLRWLERMAQCVERAARAGDISALGDLMPDLVVAVERNRKQLTQKK